MLIDVVISTSKCDSFSVSFEIPLYVVCFVHNMSSDPHNFNVLLFCCFVVLFFCLFFCVHSSDLFSYLCENITHFHHDQALVPWLVWDDPALERINVPGTVAETNWSYRTRRNTQEIAANGDLRNALAQLRLKQ